LAKNISPGKPHVRQVIAALFLPVDNRPDKTLSGEWCETISRITRTFWFFGMTSISGGIALRSRERQAFKPGRNLYSQWGKEDIIRE